MDCEGSPDREHQGEREKREQCEASALLPQMSLPDLVADPSSDGERSVPMIPEPGQHVPRSRGLPIPDQAVALCTCPSATMYSETCHQRGAGRTVPPLSVWFV